MLTFDLVGKTEINVEITCYIFKMTRTYDFYHLLSNKQLNMLSEDSST